MERRSAHHNMVMGDFNTKVGKKVTEETVSCKNCVDSRNESGQILVNIVENPSHKSMNTFLDKKMQ